MLILREFFERLRQIQLLQSSIIGNTPETNFDLYNKYLQDRLEFADNYQRIFRGIDLLTEEQFLLLYDYFSGRIQSGRNLKTDKQLCKMIYDVENAI